MLGRLKHGRHGAYEVLDYIPWPNLYWTWERLQCEVYIEQASLSARSIDIAAGGGLLTSLILNP